jgi:NADPH:quinone reductase-like Zn-dependent oxidoreductase
MGGVADRAPKGRRRALTSDGVYVMVGGSTARICGCLLLGPVVSLAAAKGFLWWQPFRQTDVVTLTGLIDSRGVRPVIDRRYPLAEVPEALRYLESGRAQGKLVHCMQVRQHV